MVPSDAFQRAESVAPVEGLLSRVRAYYEDRQWREGQQLLERAIRLSPQNAEAWYLMARGYYHLGELAKSQRFAMRAGDLISVASPLGKLNAELLQKLTSR